MKQKEKTVKFLNWIEFSLCVFVFHSFFHVSSLFSRIFNRQTNREKIWRRLCNATCYMLHYRTTLRTHKEKKQNSHQFLDEHIQAHVYECVSHTVYVRMVVAGARFFLFYFASFSFNLFLHLKSSGLLSIFH